MGTKSLKHGGRSAGVMGLILVCTAGCMTMQPEEPAAPQTRAISYELPTLTPVEPAKQDQERDGIRISIAPYTYSPTETVRREYRRVPSLFVVNDQVAAEMREIRGIDVNPKEVRFKVKISNRLERVLRLQGTVVSFQVAGRSVAVDSSRYEDFLSGIILPRQEMEYEIVGPDLEQVPDGATLAFLLYDIVTATDNAGNPTQRSNFEFFYTLTREARTAEVTQAPTTRVSLDPVSAQTLVRRESAPGAWVAMPELDGKL